MLIFRYFSRELFNTLLTVTLIVLIVFLGNQLIRYLNDAAAGNMALLIVGKLLLLEVPYLLALLLPLTFFLALLLTQSRFYADHELLVLKACGLTPTQEWRMSAKLSISTCCLIAFLSLWIQPKLAVYRNELLATTNTGASIQTLVPGKFQTSGNNRFVFYVEKSSVDHQHLSNIFIAEKKLPESNTSSEESTQWNIVKAVNGQLVKDNKTSAEFMQINDGQRYIGNAGQKNYQVIRFERYLMLTRNPTNSTLGNEMDGLSTSKLFLLAKNHKIAEEIKKHAQAELEWRISLPVACFLLSLLAILLGNVPPREGRYARLFPGILILIIYTNLLFVSRSWLAEGAISWFPGMLWVHLALALFIALLKFPPKKQMGKALS